jgi:hypothetical protein
MIDLDKDAKHMKIKYILFNEDHNLYLTPLRSSG